MVGYKAKFKHDPCFDTDRIGELTSSCRVWSDHLVDRPENTMTGVSFARAGTSASGETESIAWRLFDSQDRSSRSPTTSSTASPAADLKRYSTRGW